MDKFILLLVGLLTFFGCCNAQANTVNTSTAGLDALVRRQLPFHADKFVFHLEPQAQINVKNHTALDTFTLFDADGKINVECSTRSACARGLYTYLLRCLNQTNGKIPHRNRESGYLLDWKSLESGIGSVAACWEEYQPSSYCTLAIPFQHG